MATVGKSAPSLSRQDLAVRENAVAMWLKALRNHADAAALRLLPPLTDADAARVMALLRDETPQTPGHFRDTLPPKPPDIATGQFRPRITLMTLGRGDGLLGMQPRASWGRAATA